MGRNAVKALGTRPFHRRRILLVESDPWRAESLRAFLAADGFEVVTDTAGGGPVDVALLNLADAEGELRERVEALRTTRPTLKLAAFVRRVEADTVFPCLLLGVKGIVPFDAPKEEIRQALACVLEGSLWTPRPVLSQWIDRIVSMGLGESPDRAFTSSERRVLSGLREDLSNKEIARRLGVTEATVKFHVGKLLRKTGSRDRRELARFVRETVPTGAAVRNGDSTEG